MTAKFQDNLNQDYGVCRFSNGRISPCGYHSNKGSNTIFGLFDYDLEDFPNQVRLKNNKDIKKLSTLFNSSRPPAGGWYLVGEQRDWLRKQVNICFNSIVPKDECRILVAGIASIYHHYSYAWILHEAAKESKINHQQIALDIVDKCVYPLIQIGAVESQLNTNKALKRRQKVFQHEFYIGKKEIEFIRKLRPFVKAVNTQLYLRDLRLLDDLEEQRNYDIITEHFLSSLLMRNTDHINSTRATYANMLKTGGKLLVASGIEDKEYRNEFIRIHREKGLVLEDSTKTWDPYGMDQDQIKALAFNNQATIDALKDNELFVFVRK